MQAHAGDMSEFDVEVCGADGRTVARRVGLEAQGPGEALLRARRYLDAGAASGSAGEGWVYAVYRHRRVRGRRLVGYFSGGADGGSAGVREPRRPLPHPPSDAVALEVPAGQGSVSGRWPP